MECTLEMGDILRPSPKRDFKFGKDCFTKQIGKKSISQDDLCLDHFRNLEQPLLEDLAFLPDLLLE
eukprot:661039-Ditylum_brightwellii.AAC.1